MPIATICLVRGHVAERIQATIKGVSETLTRITNAPRITVWVNEIDPQLWTAQGTPAAELLRMKPIHEIDSPLVTIVMIEGRTVEQHRDLISGVTEVLAKELDIDPMAVRVNIQQTDPERFGIGGLQASVLLERTK